MEIATEHIYIIRYLQIAMQNDVISGESRKSSRRVPSIAVVPLPIPKYKKLDGFGPLYLECFFCKMLRSSQGQQSPLNRPECPLRRPYVPSGQQSAPSDGLSAPQTAPQMVRVPP